MIVYHNANFDLSPVHTGDYSRRIRRQSPNSATIVTSVAYLLSAHCLAYFFSLYFNVTQLGG